METWVIVAIAVVAAVVLIAVIVAGVCAYRNRRGPAYTDEKLTELIKKAYAETGKPESDIEVVKIADVQREDAEGRSVFDVRIKHLAGEFAGKTMNFRYTLLMTPPGGEGTLVVESVVAAPTTTALPTA